MLGKKNSILKTFKMEKYIPQNRTKNKIKSKAYDLLEHYEISGVEIREASKIIENSLFQQNEISLVALDNIKNGLLLRQKSKMKFARAFNYILKKRGVDKKYSVEEIFD